MFAAQLRHAFLAAQCRPDNLEREPDGTCSPLHGDSVLSIDQSLLLCILLDLPDGWRLWSGVLDSYQIPIKGCRRTQSFALGTVLLLYQLISLYRFEYQHKLQGDSKPS